MFFSPFFRHVTCGNYQESEQTCASVEDLVARTRNLNLLGHFILQILNDECVGLVEDGESVPRHPNGRQPGGPFAFRRVGCGVGVAVNLGNVVKIVRRILHVGSLRADQNRVLRRIVAVKFK